MSRLLSSLEAGSVGSCAPEKTAVDTVSPLVDVPDETVQDAVRGRLENDTTKLCSTKWFGSGLGGVCEAAMARASPVTDVQCREYCRLSEPEQISLDLGTLRKNWKLMQKNTHERSCERGKRWTAWRQTLKSRPTARRRAQGIRRPSAHTSTFFRQPAAFKAPMQQERPDARNAFVVIFSHERPPFSTRYRHSMELWLK